MKEETVIKISYLHEVVYYDSHGVCKFKDTNLPLDGIYEEEIGTIYYKNGKNHNENGPAYIGKSGYKQYLINGKLHRIDGPAEIYSNGSVTWRINGHKIDGETMDNWLTENDIPLDWNIWSNEDKMMFALHWSDYE